MKGENNKILLPSTEELYEYPVINHNRKEYEKECIYMYIYVYNWVTLLYRRDQHNDVNQLYFN